MESGLHITLASERLFTVWGIPVTNTIVAMWVVIAALLVAAFIIGRNLSLVPSRVQSALEMAYEYVYGYVHDTLGSDTLARRYFPLIATIFLFIFTVNLIEFSPLFGPLTVAGQDGSVPLFHVVSSDLNTTLTLAIIAFLVVEISGILTLGVLKYGSKFVNFRGGAMGFVIGLLEIIGNLARLVSLSFRLFGAIFAGETLVLVIEFFAPYVAPVPLMAFELFIGFLQAAIFAILTLAYIKLALEEPHGSSSSHAQSHAPSH
ncbi:MAG TPA: F0F1 ATP synthase subunit A [Candidatus Paceibacterota bacterium]|nr:F0F1 ATP synthase subunit A [Candidatus Paceibacterota bacterium]